METFELAKEVPKATRIESFFVMFLSYAGELAVTISF